MRRRVTFSRNVTLSLSRTCRCYCKYCAFATHKPHLQEPDEVLAHAGVDDLSRYAAGDGDLRLDIFVDGWGASEPRP